MKLLCWLGLHRKVTREEIVSEFTTNYYTTCSRCGKEIDSCGITHVFSVKIPL